MNFLRFFVQLLLFPDLLICIYNWPGANSGQRLFNTNNRVYVPAGPRTLSELKMASIRRLVLPNYPHRQDLPVTIFFIHGPVQLTARELITNNPDPGQEVDCPENSAVDREILGQARFCQIFRSYERLSLNQINHLLSPGILSYRVDLMISPAFLKMCRGLD